MNWLCTSSGDNAFSKPNALNSSNKYFDCYIIYVRKVSNSCRRLIHVIHSIVNHAALRAHPLLGRFWLLASTKMQSILGLSACLKDELLELNTERRQPWEIDRNNEAILWQGQFVYGLWRFRFWVGVARFMGVSSSSTRYYPLLAVGPLVWWIPMAPCCKCTTLTNISLGYFHFSNYFALFLIHGTTTAKSNSWYHVSAPVNASQLTHIAKLFACQKETNDRNCYTVIIWLSHPEGWSHTAWRDLTILTKN